MGAGLLGAPVPGPGQPTQYSAGLLRTWGDAAHQTLKDRAGRADVSFTRTC
jgi:hypothetical protein